MCLILDNLVLLTSVGPSDSFKVRQLLLVRFDQIQGVLQNDTVAYQRLQTAKAGLFLGLIAENRYKFGIC